MTDDLPGVGSELDRMGVDAFASLLANPTAAQRAALIDELGEARYLRMHELALARDSRSAVAPKGNVVVLHGIMGGELSTLVGGAPTRVWLRLLRIVSGQIDRLRLAADGADPDEGAFDVQATGILKRAYGELLLSLAADWNVEAFWFDWRKDLSLAADELSSRIRAWFADEPVHLVAHSMGGLVSRTFIARHPDQWEAMNGRLVMLGTPNHGSFAIPQAITGLDPLVRKLAKVDLSHSRGKLLEILNSFPGTYQMLPSQLVRPDVAALYDSATWGNLDIPQAHLDRAREHHELLAATIDDRMIYVAGAGVPTLDGADATRPASADGYTATWDGDGRVSHALGRLDGVPTYYVETDHGGLTAHVGVLDCLTELLTTGETVRLATEPPVTRATDEAAMEALRERADGEVALLDLLVATPAAGARGTEPRPEPEPEFGAAQAREIEDEIVRGLLQSSRYAARDAAPVQPAPRASIRIRLAVGDIRTIHDEPGLRTIDVLATGHYADVLPQAAEKALDRAISDWHDGDELGKLILRGFSLRGVLRGRLGEPFLLPDPRSGERLIAIAGMGDPGRFGATELTVLARQLCWSLGRLGRRHLATVVIGAGNGNLTARVAIGAWLRGIRLALADEADALETVTFVEEDPRKVLRIHAAIIASLKTPDRTGLDVDYELLGDPEALRTAAQERAKDEALRGLDDGGYEDGDEDSAPTRITLSLDGDTYRFGALTERAAVPERAIPLDPVLVGEANTELAGEGDRLLQLERGQFLGQLLFPQDLVPHLATHAPLVMLLDGKTAEIYWEMVGQTGADAGFQTDDDGFLDGFLGTRRGLTRQLRTRFAPPPEPPPPPRRRLRVLVVADPADDAHLPGAQAEGIAVVDAFERFNDTYPDGGNSVEVRALLGPRDATRTNVLRELVQRPYDVLHFAGHCVYDPVKPSLSGWIFSGGHRIGTNELSRLVRVPRFVFSNACESGVTLEDAQATNPELAPTFAGAFFARGVSEFVCTAWRVKDSAALQFASVLYAQLLGLPPAPGEPAPGVAAPMHTAMREARRAIAITPQGARTWGAYQHYGNPHFRLFEHLTAPRTDQDGNGR